jgi:hypothetical protein
MAQYEDEAFDENGVLRDRARYRVPMHMRDGQSSMITDGTDDPFGLHRPGWRIASGSSERDSQRKLIEEARAQYLYHLQNGLNREFLGR